MVKLPKRGRGEDTLGGRLTRRRLRKGWTQEQLAMAVGTSQAVVQRIESGKCRHPRIVKSLARTLDVSPAWLMYGVEAMEPEELEVARAWARLPPAHRRMFKRMITGMVVVEDQTQTQPAASAPEPASAPGLADVADASGR